MANKPPKISLSLLDLLFCAFGGVIVMAVVFISIAGEPKGLPTRKNAHIQVRLKSKYNDFSDATIKIAPDSLGVFSKDFITQDTCYGNGDCYTLHHYSENLSNSIERQTGRLTCYNIEGDTVNLTVQIGFDNLRIEPSDSAYLEVIRFQDGHWETFKEPILSFSQSTDNINTLPLKIPLR